jgi:hypothetical protein
MTDSCIPLMVVGFGFAGAVAAAVFLTINHHQLYQVHLYQTKVHPVEIQAPVTIRQHLFPW